MAGADPRADRHHLGPRLERVGRAARPSRPHVLDGATCPPLASPRTRTLVWKSLWLSTDQERPRTGLCQRPIRWPSADQSRGRASRATCCVDLRPQHGRGLREQLEHGLRAAIQSGGWPPGPRCRPRACSPRSSASRAASWSRPTRTSRADGYLEARQGAGHARARRRRAERRTRARTRCDRVVFGARAGSPRARRRSACSAGCPTPRCSRARSGCATTAPRWPSCPTPSSTYPSTRGAEPLRAALTAYLGRVRGVDTDARPHARLRRLHAGRSSLLCRALRRAGARRVAIEDPCFGLHREAIAMTGLEPVPVAGRRATASTSRALDATRRRRRARRARALLPDRRHARRRAPAPRCRLGARGATR